jgi:hypothetical protein
LRFHIERLEVGHPHNQKLHLLFWELAEVPDPQVMVAQPLIADVRRVPMA